MSRGWGEVMPDPDVPSMEGLGIAALTLMPMCCSEAEFMDLWLTAAEVAEAYPRRPHANVGNTRLRPARLTFGEDLEVHALQFGQLFATWKTRSALVLNRSLISEPVLTFVCEA